MEVFLFVYGCVGDPSLLRIFAHGKPEKQRFNKKVFFRLTGAEADTIDSMKFGNTDSRMEASIWIGLLYKP